MGDRAGLGPPPWDSGAAAQDPAGQAPLSTPPGCPDVISAVSFILSIRAGLRDQQQVHAGAAPLVSHWGTVGPAAFRLCPHSQLTPSPPPLHSFPPAPSHMGPKAEGRWERAGRGWSRGGMAGGRSGGGWAVGSDGEVQLPLLFLRQLLTWLDVVVLDEAIVILSLQVGSTRHGVALTGPPT